MTAGRPVLLDLFCGAGGAAMGYHRAGFDVVGVDIKPQPRYPFEFVQADALEYVARVGHLFNAVHGSPPCQFYANVTAWRGSPGDHPDLVGSTREALNRTGRPWVIENVPEAAYALRPDLTLCGSQFGLRVKRHRIFQLSWPVSAMLPPCHHHRGLLPFMHKGERAYADAMGCTWMDKTAARQAIPPAYTRFIGEQLLAHLSQAVTP